MELVDYLKVLWRYKWGMLLILVISVSVTAGAVEYFSPGSYQATATLEVTNSTSVPIPGYTSTVSENDNQTSIYEAIVDSPNFKNDVLLYANKKLRLTSSELVAIKSFNVKATQVPQTPILTLDVDASKPQWAIVLANTAAEQLQKKMTEIRSNVTDDNKKMIGKELDRIDAELVKLRTEMETAKAQQPVADQSAKSTELAHIQDKINESQVRRQTYTDFLTKLWLTETLSEQKLQIVYNAASTASLSKRRLLENTLVTAFTGTIMALGFVGVCERRRRRLENISFGAN